ncbi:hypothetical protein T265_09211 [Opisthorchis viverrini]|uniref:Uncharacterized protein n=1 Tax=Opisthorchis viverrini TaxID=6198 RepID=A0A074Z6H0_OPIVI|nr:hypothetical protein T265_09211 [Opisthorchis viverrini]KER22766.1 hypothetical protein T265_09211 [Opisthorchis viverrini]
MFRFRAQPATLSIGSFKFIPVYVTATSGLASETKAQLCFPRSTKKRITDTNIINSSGPDLNGDTVGWNNDNLKTEEYATYSDKSRFQMGTIKLHKKPERVGAGQNRMNVDVAPVHKVPENSSATQDRLCPFWDSSDKCNPRVSIKLLFYLKPNWTDFDKCTHLNSKLVIKGDSTESLVYNILQYTAISRILCQLKHEASLGCELTDQKVRVSSPIPTSHLVLSRFWQPGRIPAIMNPSGVVSLGHREVATATFFKITVKPHQSLIIANASSPIEVTSSVRRQLRTDDVTSTGVETFPIQLPNLANRPTTHQRTQAPYIPKYCRCFCLVAPVGMHENCQTRRTDQRPISAPRLPIFQNTADETTHWVAENSSTAHDRFRLFRGSSAGQFDCKRFITTTNPQLLTTTLPSNAVMSPRLVMKRLQSNCPAQRTSQQPPFLNTCGNRSTVVPFQSLIAMPPEGSTWAGILPECPSLDKESQKVEVGFEPRTFGLINSRSNH